MTKSNAKETSRAKWLMKQEEYMFVLLHLYKKKFLFCYSIHIATIFGVCRVSLLFRVCPLQNLKEEIVISYHGGQRAVICPVHKVSHAGQAVYRGRSPRWTCAGPSAAPSVPADDSELAATVGLQLILPKGK